VSNLASNTTPNSAAGAPIVVVASGATDQRAAALAVQLNLPLFFSADALSTDCLAWLGYRDSHLCLHPFDARQSGPIAVDFVAGATARRALGGAELIVKAVRGRSKQPLTVLDATAGLGRDSFVLASRGFAVTAIEREPIIAALLADGLTRARAANDEVAEIAARITLRQSDTVDYLTRLAEHERPDVIYLDPMFAPSQKSALVKKDMRLFQQLLHRPSTIRSILDEQAADTLLLQTARNNARVRVVVKRSAKAQPLAASAPDYALSGKAVRFDVYTVQ
jgi:16S rRNA (guanine1516-N2)-methyltransferase